MDELGTDLRHCFAACERQPGELPRHAMNARNFALAERLPPGLDGHLIAPAKVQQIAAKPGK